jgi:phosphonate transport system permease protein
MNSGARPSVQARHGVPAVVLRPWLVAAAIVAFYTVCWRMAEIDPGRLVVGLPKLVHWMARAWPPDISELPLFVARTGQTVAMAAHMGFCLSRGN